MDLLHLEVRNAITQQSTDAVILFEQSDVVASPGQLLSGGHSRRAASNHGHTFACSRLRWLRFDPSFRPAAIDDRVLDGFDANGIVVDVQSAGCLAWSGANTPGELGKVVGAVKNRQRLVPVLAKHEVVEVGNNVVDRATATAERNPAIHAARALPPRLLFAEMLDKLAPVFLA